jgi:hypothetical protein
VDLFDHAVINPSHRVTLCPVANTSTFSLLRVSAYNAREWIMYTVPRSPLTANCNAISTQHQLNNTNLNKESSTPKTYQTLTTHPDNTMPHPFPFQPVDAETLQWMERERERLEAQVVALEHRHRRGRDMSDPEDEDEHHGRPRPRPGRHFPAPRRKGGRPGHGGGPGP